jgi:multiple sugar transport system substrate-binding protein
MVKKMVVLAVLAAVLATGLYAGGRSDSGSAQTQGGTPLTVWMKKGFVDEQNVMFEQRVREFVAAKNVPVVVELIAYEDFFPKWAAAISSGNVPDVSYFGYQEVGQFYPEGVLEDVSQVVRDIQGKTGSFFVNSLNAVTFEGKQYAVPFWGEGTALYYRKDLLAAAGYNNPPDTWEQFREIAKKTTNAQQNIFGAGLGFGSGNSDAEWLTRAMLWANGASIFDKNGKIALDTPEARELCQWLADIFLVDKSTPPSAIGWNDSGNNTAYLSGQAAMIVNTGSVVNAIRNQAPELLEKTGVVVLPRGKAGRFTAGLNNTLGIFKAAKNKDLAKELLVYLTDYAWYQKWINASVPLALPVFEKIAQEDPVWKDPYNKAFMDSMSTFVYLGHPAPYSPAAGKIANLRLINSMFESIIANRRPVDAAIREFVTEATKAQ